MSECLNECPAYNYAGECVSACPAEAAFVYEDNKTCAGWCKYYTLSSDYQKRCEPACPKYCLAADNNSYQCVSTCPSGQSPNDSSVCVEKAQNSNVNTSMVLSGTISGLCFLAMVVLAIIGACAPKRPLVYNYRIPNVSAGQA